MNAACGRTALKVCTFETLKEMLSATENKSMMWPPGPKRSCKKELPQAPRRPWLEEAVRGAQSGRFFFSRKGEASYVIYLAPPQEPRPRQPRRGGRGRSQEHRAKPFTRRQRHTRRGAAGLPTKGLFIHGGGPLARPRAVAQSERKKPRWPSPLPSTVGPSSLVEATTMPTHGPVKPVE